MAAAQRGIAKREIEFAVTGTCADPGYLPQRREQEELMRSDGRFSASYPHGTSNAIGSHS